jgi:Zn-dependent protease with chaperone function
MSDLKSLRKNAFCLCATLMVFLFFSLSTSFASPKRPKTAATYYCDIDAKGKARVNFSLLSKTPITDEQKASLEKALGFPLSDKFSRYEAYESDEIEGDVEEELSEEEYAEESEQEEKKAPNQRDHLLFGKGGRTLATHGFLVKGDFDLKDVINVLQELQIDSFVISINHAKIGYSECTQSTGLDLPESLPEHYDSYMLALSEGVVEPSLIHISYGYPTSHLVKKISIMGGIFLFTLLFIAFRRRKLTRLAAIDSSSARFAAFRSLNMLSVGFPLVWLLAISLTGVNEAFSFIETGRGAIFRVTMTIVWYMVFPLIMILICKAILYPFLTNADDRQFKFKHFWQDAMTLVFGSFLPLICVLAGVVAMVRGDMVFGLGCMGASYISKLIAKSIQQKNPGGTAYTLVVKSLRDRVFEIAARAGVNLTEVYVLPLDKDKTANAFATTKNTVLLSEYLLRRLSRREVDAVVAHEIGHLRLNHPRILSICFFIGLVVPMFLPSILQFAMMYLVSISPKFIYLSLYLHRTDLLFPISIALSTLVSLVLSRRFEFSADAFSVTITGDAEAMITALIRLARLSLLPMDWGKWDESLLTHPSTMNRIRSLAGKYGVSPQRLEELIQDTSEPEDSYSLQETVAPLPAPAELSHRPAPAYQINTNPQAQAKKKAQKYSFIPLQAAFFVMLFLFFLLLQVQSIKNMATASGFPMWLIILLGGVATLLVSSYLIKKQLIRLMPSKIEYFRTNVKNYAGIDGEGLQKYTDELTQLGFQQVMDYTFETNRKHNLQPFSRLFVHPQQHCFAEVCQIMVGSIGVTKIFCSISSAFEGEWYYSTQDKEIAPSIYGNRLPNSLFDTKQGASVFELFNFHMANREVMATLLNSQVNKDLAFESYLTVGAKLEFKKREKIRNKIAFLYLLELDKCARKTKSSWYGKLEKPLSQNHLEHLLKSKAHSGILG